jgi:putative ABC transport system permease protein
MNQALLVTKNLGRRKLRTSLMLVAIFIAFFLYGCLECVNRAFYSTQNSAGAADRLVTVSKVNFTLPLPVNYADRIREMPGVTHVTYQSWFGGYYQDARNVLFSFAVDPKEYLEVYPNMVMPPEQRHAFLTDRIAIAAGRAVAAKYHWQVGDHLPLASNIYRKADGSHTWDFTVAAIFSSPDDSARENLVILHHDYFDETVTFGRDHANMIMFSTASPQLNDSIAKAIDARFANSAAETTTDTAAAFNRAFTAQFGNIALMISLVVGTAFAAILLIVGNTMVMAVRERTREIGVLKTLGYRGKTILAQILAESLALSLVGATLGLAAATGFIAATSHMLSGFTGGMRMSLPVLAAGVGWAVLLGLVTGAVPAWSGMQLSIATALGRR